MIRLSTRSLAKTVALLATVASLSVVSTAWAGPALDTVKAKQTQLFDLLGKPSSPQTQKVRK